jgi:hypothetical protein
MNVFDEIGNVAKTVAKDVAHAVVETVEFPDKAVKVWETISADYPTLKPALLKVVTDSAAVESNVVEAVKDDGLNVTVDIQTWNSIKAVITDLVAARNEIEAAYNALNTDVQ